MFVGAIFSAIPGRQQQYDVASLSGVARFRFRGTQAFLFAPNGPYLSRSR